MLCLWPTSTLRNGFAGRNIQGTPLASYIPRISMQRYGLNRRHKMYSCPLSAEAASFEFPVALFSRQSCIREAQEILGIAPGVRVSELTGLGVN